MKELIIRALAKAQFPNKEFSAAEEKLLRTAVTGSPLENSWPTPKQNINEDLKSFLNKHTNRNIEEFWNFVENSNPNIVEELKNDEDFKGYWDTHIDPLHGACWGKERTIDAKLIEWLCIDNVAHKMVTHKGVNIRDCKIEGKGELNCLRLDFADIPFPLIMRSCFFSGDIRLQYSTIKQLMLDGSCIQGLHACGMTIKGSLTLANGFQANRTVALAGTTIGGDFDCSGGFFYNSTSDNERDPMSLCANGISVKQNVYFDNGFKAKADVRVCNKIT